MDVTITGRNVGVTDRFRTYVGRLENEAASPMVVDLQDLADALGVGIPELLDAKTPSSQ